MYVDIISWRLEHDGQGVPASCSGRKPEQKNVNWLKYYLLKEKSRLIDGYRILG